MATATKGPYAADFNVGIIRFLLRSMWKVRDVKINNISVLPITNAEHIISHIRNLTTEVTQDWEDSKLINLGERDTSGAFDSVTNTGRELSRTTHAGAQTITSNFGARNGGNRVLYLTMVW